MIKIPEEIINQFKLPPGVFLSGSRAMGFPHEKSDWDVCIPFYIVDDLKNGLNEYQSSGYFEGFVHVWRDYKINFIPLHPLDMLCWFLATKTIYDMNSNLGCCRLRDIESRHGLFEIFRGAFKASIFYQGPDETLNIVEKMIAES